MPWKRGLVFACSNGFPAAHTRRHRPESGWLRRPSGWKMRRSPSVATLPVATTVYRTTSLVNQCTAAKAGIGLALLPCYLGDEDSDLVRALPGPVPGLAGELWIVTHADLKRTARVRAFFDIVGEGLAREHNLFEGRG